MALSWVITSKSSSEPSSAGTMRFTWWDVVVLCGFAVFAFGTFLGRWKGVTPFVFLSSDAGIVSSFVAAYEHPDLFRGDVLLGDFTNFRYYLALHPLLIYVINNFTGDYGLAFISLLILTVFLQSTGFYLLGLTLFQNRYWAFLLAVINLCPVPLPVREFWGIYDDPLPRTMFHAWLPFVLTAAFHFRSKVRIWPWLMVFMGIAFYTHPVSAPPWAFAIWLGFWAFLPATWTWFKKPAYMVMLGLIFVITVMPWASNFLLVHDRPASEVVQYKDVVGIIADRVGKELLDVGLALKLWWLDLSSWPLWFYSLWAVTGSTALWYMRRDVRKDIKLVVIWCVGILFVSVGLTFLEQTLCRVYDLKRFQMDSIRGIKYLVPLMLLMCLWPLAKISEQFESDSLKRKMISLIGAFLVGVWIYQNPPSMFVESASSWAKGSLMPGLSQSERDTIEAVKAINMCTEPGARILPLALPLEIRYSALRSVVYAYKDGGIFADTNLGSLLEWDRVKTAIDEINSSQNPDSKLQRFLNLTLKLGADYLLTDFGVAPDLASTLGAQVIWFNNSYTLLRFCPNQKCKDT